MAMDLPANPGSAEPMLSALGKEELENRAKAISRLQSMRRKEQVRLEEIHFSWRRVLIVWGVLSLAYLVVDLLQSLYKLPPPLESLIHYFLPFPFNPKEVPYFFCAIAILFVGSWLASSVVWDFHRSATRNRIGYLNRELASLGVFELTHTQEPDFFTKLIQINFQYIESYYRQTQFQADRSFWIAAATAVIGFGLVAAGVSKAFYDPSHTKVAVLSSAAGILSNFIAAVLFYFYNRTIQSMASYHQKLVMTQNVSLALKTAESMQEPERGKARQTIVDRLTEGINAYLSSRAPQEQTVRGTVAGEKLAGQQSG